MSSTAKENTKLCTTVIKEYTPPDVFDVDYTNNTHYIKPNLNCDSLIFCDNVILWSIGINQRVYIQQKCKQYFDSSFELKMIRSDELKDDDIAPVGTPYYCFKISLSEVPIGHILSKLKNIVCEGIILHDIDIAQDIKCITTRKDVKDHILKNGVYKENIVDDRSKVGDNCISFYDNSHSVKVKVYNKFVQMLESCDVMTILGSRLHNLFVDPSPSFKETLSRTKNMGLTRIEVKFYGSDIYDKQDYITWFNDVKAMLQGCKFYRSSFENQWKQLVKNIYNKQVIMIYLEDKNFFAYCHWWNSLTGKMQGGTQSKVYKKDVPLLVSNYSFNGMITKLIRININSKDVTEEEYKRTTSGITLIPGPRGGLYPQTEGLLLPDEVGLVEYKEIKIGWSDIQIAKESVPLATIIRTTGEEEKLESLSDLMVSHYKAAYSILEENTRYKVISKGQLSYRGKECTVIEVTDENLNAIKVRCSTNLENYLENKTTKLWFETGTVITRTNNNKDISIK
jgi:hypothetical protein